MHTATFRVKEISDPDVVVGGKSKGTISAAVLKEQQGVLSELKNFDFDATDKIVDFTILIIRNEHALFLMHTEGNRFTSEMITALNTVEPGDKFIVADIRCRRPDNKIISLQPIELVVQ